MKKWAFVVALAVVMPGGVSVKADEAAVDVKELEASVQKALKAYNDDDHKMFWADFCSAANALKTKETFDALYTNGYKKQYGKFVKLGDLRKDKSVLQGEVGLARYKAEFAKDKAVEIDINWMKEDNKVRFLQIQINKPQEP